MAAADSKSSPAPVSAAALGTSTGASGGGAGVSSVQLKKMRVKVCVRDKLFDVVCGDGTQQIRWLANVAIARYDTSNGFELGESSIHSVSGVVLNTECVLVV